MAQHTEMKVNLYSQADKDADNDFVGAIDLVDDTRSPNDFDRSLIRLLSSRHTVSVKLTFDDGSSNTYVKR